MKANYRTRFVPNGKESQAVTLTAREAKLVEMVWAEAKRQYEEETQEWVKAVMGYNLVYLNGRFHYTGKTLTEIYKGSVQMLYDVKSDFRPSGSEKHRIGRNTEDYWYREQLRVLGVDLDKLEESAKIDEKTGKVTWDD